MMSQPQLWHPLSRNDRHVRRANLRLPPEVSEHRATFLVEESLRLMALPGEDQGRTYFFRRVALRGLAAAAPTSEWVDRAQSTMHALATRALHGNDHRARGADAVFFYSQQEALEWLLQQLLRRFPQALSSAEWFAAMIAPSTPRADIGMQVVAVIDRLRSLPSGWFAAATAVLRILYAESASVAALASIPDGVARMWLSELGGASGRVGVPRLPERGRRILRDQLREFHQDGASSLGRGESAAQTASRLLPTRHRDLPPRLVWLAALMVALEDPSVLDNGAAVAGGRRVLEELADAVSASPVAKDLDPTMSSALRSSEFASDLVDEKRRDISAGAARDLPEDRGVDGGAVENPADQAHFTPAGGFYFLLNVLRRLGIEQALGALPEQLREGFLPRLIASLARCASVAENDPALMWAGASLGSAIQDDGSACIVSAECWPRMPLPPLRTQVTPARLARVWTVAVRRWCWLNARLTLFEVVRRHGRILLTRTDLDVTLSMDTVDLRLRRAGLDLDPGWLSWFGRVVRFHYVHGPLSNGIDGGEPA